MNAPGSMSERSLAVQHGVFNSNIGVWLFLGVLASSLFLNVILARRVGSLTVSDAPKGVPVGLSLAEGIPVINLNGQPQKLTFPADRSTLLYIFAPECHSCAENEANIKALLRQRPSAVAAVLLSLSNTQLKDYVQTHSLSVPVYSVSSSAAISKFHLGITPQTLVVDGSQTVVRSWRGAFDKAVQNDVESYFGITLPGLSGRAVALR